MRLGAQPCFMLAALFLACLASTVMAQPAPAPGPDSSEQVWPPPGKPVNVCIAPMPGMVQCNASEPQETYTGFDVEMVRVIAAKRGWEDKYFFECIPFTELVERLQVVNGSCPLALAGLTITRARQEAGIQFSFPYLFSGLGVMVKTEVSTSNGWGWVEPFSWELWLTVVVIATIFPVIIFLLEWGSLKRRIKQSEILPGVHRTSVASAWTLLGLETLEVSSWGAKVASLTFALMSLVLINQYTANLAANLTIKSVTTQVRSLADLRGQLVVTSSIYQERLRSSYGIITKGLEDEGYEAIEEMVRQLEAGDIKAYLYDVPVLRGFLSNRTSCSVGMLPGVSILEPFTYGVAFSSAVPLDFVDRFSTAVLELQDDDELGRLQGLYVPTAVNAQCLEGEESGQTFKSIYGLWFVLLLGVLVGGAVAFYTRRWRFHRNKQWKDLPSDLETEEEVIDEEYDEGDLSLNASKDFGMDAKRILRFF